MDTFTLTIKLGNDAMQTPQDVAEALESAAERLMGALEFFHGKLHDENGNTVGTFDVK
jgi:molybdopterin synthase catalytic subunit